METAQKIDQSQAYLLAANLMRGEDSPKHPPIKPPEENVKSDIVRRYKQYMKRKNNTNADNPPRNHPADNTPTIVSHRRK